MNRIIRLVKKAQQGDDQAFLKIFQQHQEDIYRMAFVYMKNQEDALDVVQEVAYQSFKNINTLKKPEYFKTWLMKITINCAINTINKNKKVVQLKSKYEEYMSAEVDENIPLSLSLQDVMECLQEDEKSVVLLRFYQTYTFKEISQSLEIPLGTAKSILYRALQKLRKRLEEVEFHE
ncbi:MAG TPA: sigma-70 family RNA polymerase sigma factor [Ureibacillus sp.]|nr:sigma-70 family RNA polymerase sigma factor [Ureibacillus sp.]